MIARKHQKLEEARKDTTQSKRDCQHLNFRFLASITVRKYISIVLSTQSVVLCYRSPSNKYTFQATLKGKSLTVMHSPPTHPKKRVEEEKFYKRMKKLL